MTALECAEIRVMGVDVGVTTSPLWRPEQSMYTMWQAQLDRPLATQVMVCPADASHWAMTRDGLVVRIASPRVTRVAAPCFSAALFGAEIRRQEHGVFQTHAAGIALRGGAILLAGDSGAGKTITALRLGVEDGARYAGADRSQLGLADGRLALLGHWENTRLRTSSAHAVAGLDEVGRRLSDRVHAWLAEAPRGWDVKKTFNVKELGLTPLPGAAPVDAIYDLRVLAPDAPFELRPMVPRDAVYALSAALGDLTGGFLAPLDDDGVPLMPAFHDRFPRTAEQRHALVTAAREVPRFRLRGNFDDVCRFLVKEHG